MSKRSSTPTTTSDTLSSPTKRKRNRSGGADGTLIAPPSSPFPTTTTAFHLSTTTASFNSSSSSQYSMFSTSSAPSSIKIYGSPSFTTIHGSSTVYNHTTEVRNVNSGNIIGNVYLEQHNVNVRATDAAYYSYASRGRGEKAGRLDVRAHNENEDVEDGATSDGAGMEVGGPLNSSASRRTYTGTGRKSINGNSNNFAVDFQKALANSIEAHTSSSSSAHSSSQHPMVPGTVSDSTLSITQGVSIGSGSGTITRTQKTPHSKMTANFNPSDVRGMNKKVEKLFEMLMKATDEDDEDGDEDGDEELMKMLMGGNLIGTTINAGVGSVTGTLTGTAAGMASSPLPSGAGGGGGQQNFTHRMYNVDVNHVQGKAPPTRDNGSPSGRPAPLVDRMKNMELHDRPRSRQRRQQRQGKQRRRHDTESEIDEAESSESDFTSSDSDSSNYSPSPQTVQPQAQIPVDPISAFLKPVLINSARAPSNANITHTQDQFGNVNTNMHINVPRTQTTKNTFLYGPPAVEMQTSSTAVVTGNSDSDPSIALSINTNTIFPPTSHIQIAPGANITSMSFRGPYTQVNNITNVRNEGVSGVVVGNVSSVEYK